jgi:hypothetical protein
LVALFEQTSAELPQDLCEATAPLLQSLAALNLCLHTSDQVVWDNAKHDPPLWAMWKNETAFDPRLPA